jgi:predicted aconitase
LEQAFGHHKPQEVFRFDAKEKANILERLNSTGQDRKVDYVMLGCPHYSMEQLWELTQLIEGRKVHADCELWIFTPRSTKALCDQNGFTRIIEEAGGHILSDSCSAMSRAMPKGTRVVAMDSAKQSHYLPAILGVQAWFGSTADCVEAACTGQWQGGLK